MIEWIVLYFVVNFVLATLVMNVMHKEKESEEEKKEKYVALILVWFFGLPGVIFILPVQISKQLAKRKVKE